VIHQGRRDDPGAPPRALVGASSAGWMGEKGGRYLAASAAATDEGLSNADPVVTTGPRAREKNASGDGLSWSAAGADTAERGVCTGGRLWFERNPGRRATTVLLAQRGAATGSLATEEPARASVVRRGGGALPATASASSLAPSPRPSAASWSSLRAIASALSRVRLSWSSCHGPTYIEPGERVQSSRSRLTASAHLAVRMALSEPHAAVEIASSVLQADDAMHSSRRPRDPGTVAASIARGPAQSRHGDPRHVGSLPFSKFSAETEELELDRTRGLVPGEGDVIVEGGDMAYR
jgi:hypothetical protein